MLAPTMKNAAEEIPRHLDIGCPERAAARDTRRASALFDRVAEGLEHALGVIARRRRLGHAGAAVRIQSRQQYRRFDLRVTCNGNRCRASWRYHDPEATAAVGC
jgi:hypothetical protein